MTEKFSYLSPLGYLITETFNDQIIKIAFSDTEAESAGFNPGLKETVSLQLDEYFEGSRFEFDLPLYPKGTAFQKEVWKHLAAIPYGMQITYLELAMQMGDKKLIRAVGGANSRNPLALVVPCHRVIGAGNKLIGYAGGIWRKKWLLQHENFHKPFKTTLL